MMKKISISKSFLLNLLRHIKHGEIILHDNGNKISFLGTKDIQATIYIKQPRAYMNIMLKGSLGAAESYIDGDWEADDLSTLIEIFILNMALFEKIEGKTARFFNYCRDFVAKYYTNLIDRAKSNILAHYDLGNEFFQLFLDPTLMYSCAIYEPETLSQEAASAKKLATVCRHLDLTSSDHILEIGTGWGSFAIFAAREYGCKVTTTTISNKQYHFVKNEIARLKLDDKIELLNQDYRELTGSYDKIVSIEMIEAVGHQYFDTFFRQCNHLLRPGGLLFLQAILINDAAYERAKNEIDFIKKYIFPGGCLPSISAITQSIASQTQLQLLLLHDIGRHYVTTLKDWHHKLIENKEAIHQLGFSEEFIRMWEYYFCYCMAGFNTRCITDIHAVWRKR